MSIRTHIPWLNFSGSSTKVVNNGCCNSSYSHSEFSGLGTRNFNFTRINSSNSCGYGTYGYNNYGSCWNSGFGGYYNGHGMNNYYGYCGGSNWFNKFSQILSFTGLGLSLGNWLGNLFSKKTPSFGMYGNYNPYMYNKPMNIVYRDKITTTITKEKNPETGEDEIKITKSTIKVPSKDGETTPIETIDNKAGIYLNEKNEIVYRKKTVITKEKVFNEETQKYEIKTTTRTYNVPSEDGETTDLEPIIIDKTDEEPPNNKKTDANNNPENTVIASAATSNNQKISKNEQQNNEVNETPQVTRKELTKNDLLNPPNLEKINSEELKNEIKNFCEKIDKSVEYIQKSATILGLKDFKIDYSTLPTLNEAKGDYSEDEVVHDYINKLLIWSDLQNINFKIKKTNRVDNAVNILKRIYPNKSSEEINNALDRSGNKIKEASEILKNESQLK